MIPRIYKWKIFFIIFLLICLKVNAQSDFDALINFASEDFLEFEYQYEEFDPNTYSDSTIILNSFDGIQTILIDTIECYNDSIEKSANILDENYLNLNYPNPFNPCNLAQLAITTKLLW